MYLLLLPQNTAQIGAYEIALVKSKYTLQIYIHVLHTLSVQNKTAKRQKMLQQHRDVTGTAKNSEVSHCTHCITAQSYSSPYQRQKSSQATVQKVGT